MDNLSFIKKLPPMLAGKRLEDALTILPDYDPEIVYENEAVRLMALSDMYRIFVPTQMAKEIYTRMYLSLLRSLEKKESKIAVKQFNENHKAVREQSYSGIIGGSDSFTIIGASGIGKSSAVTRAIQLLTAEEVIEIKKPFSKIIPCVLVQTPFDSSIKGLLYEILRVVDEKLGSKYYANALRARSTTDMLIGAVSQVALNHIGMLVVDEIQHVVNHKNGKTLVNCLTQLINNSGISIAMVGTPESAVFFTQAMQLARRALGLHYETLEYGQDFYALCEILYGYQYVRNRTKLNAATVQWLYEHSSGNISTVVTLIHDAQELSILDDSEILNLDTMRAAYQSRVAMLHPYITAPKQRQTSAPMKKEPIPQVEQPECEVQEVDSIQVLILRAKNDCKDVVFFLKAYIPVEVVRV